MIIIINGHIPNYVCFMALIEHPMVYRFFYFFLLTVYHCHLYVYRIFRLQYHVHLMIIYAFVDIFHQQTLTHFLCSSPCLFLGYACCLRSEDHNKVLLAVWAPGESLCALEKTLHMGRYWNILGHDWWFGT